jgi:uncharacterized protein (UPF0264 family)
MTRLLVSVRNCEEALLARAAGAHLIDVKEPQRGSLGAAEAFVLRSVRQCLHPDVPLSAALGELVDDGRPRDHSVLSGYSYAKLGLGGCRGLNDWPRRWADELRSFPGGVCAVAVAYADFEAARAPDPDEVIRVGCELGCRALLFDTHDKSRGSLFDQLSIEEVARLGGRARAAGMLVVLAGSLGRDAFEDAMSLRPDYLAIRGDACRGGRLGMLDQTRVERWVERLAGVRHRASADPVT